MRGDSRPAAGRQRGGSGEPGGHQLQGRQDCWGTQLFRQKANSQQMHDSAPSAARRSAHLEHADEEAVGGAAQGWDVLLGLCFLLATLARPLLLAIIILPLRPQLPPCPSGSSSRRCRRPQRSQAAASCCGCLCLLALPLRGLQGRRVVPARWTTRAVAAVPTAAPATACGQLAAAAAAAGRSRAQ